MFSIHRSVSIDLQKYTLDNMKQGFLYVVDGTRYASEAVLAIKRLRELSSLPVCIVCDKYYEEINSIVDTKTSVLIAEEIHRSKFVSKIVGMMSTPFEETLYMDTDTYVCLKIDNIFDALKLYDIAMTIEPSVNTSQFRLDDNFAYIIPEYNTGVVLFRRNGNTRNLFEAWKYNIDNKIFSNDYFDMPQLRKTFLNLESTINIGVLCENYNLHGLRTYLIIHGPVFIIHERMGTYWNSWSERMLDNNRMKKIANRINSSKSKRLFIPYINICINTRRVSLVILIEKLKMKLGFKKINKRNSI
jgi:hypothetical protein